MATLRNLPFIVVVIWSLAAVEAADDPCALSTIAQCSEKVFFYAVKPVVSTTPEGVAEDCKREEEAIECANRFESGGCIKGGLLLGMYKIIFEGATSEHKMKCEVGHPKNLAYYKHVPCFNKIGKKLGDCMRAMSSVLEASATQAPLTNRVPYTCCSMRDYENCIKRTVAAACTKSHVDYASSIIQGIAGDFQSTICAPYKEKQCQALPKLKLRKAKHTTLVPSVLENLRALG